MNKRNRFPDHERRQVVKLARQTLNSDEGKPALDYLVNERGINKEILDRFQVGFCPSRSSHELSNRIVTPICDPYGEPVALSSRHFVNKKNFFHESYLKTFYLYGLHIAKEFILKYNRAIVAEGEFDVLYLHSCNFPMSVGICGSAFTIFHAAVLMRYCSNVFFIYDGDDKLNASIRRTDKLFKDNKLSLHGVRFFYVRLPDGLDPDDFIKQKGRKAFIELLKQTKQKALS